VTHVFERRGGVLPVVDRLGEPFRIGVTHPVRGRAFKTLGIDEPSVGPDVGERLAAQPGDDFPDRRAAADAPEITPPGLAALAALAALDAQQPQEGRGVRKLAFEGLRHRFDPHVTHPALHHLGGAQAGPFKQVHRKQGRAPSPGAPRGRIPRRPTGNCLAQQRRVVR